MRDPNLGDIFFFLAFVVFFRGMDSRYIKYSIGESWRFMESSFGGPRLYPPSKTSSSFKAFLAVSPLLWLFFDFPRDSPFLNFLLLLALMLLFGPLVFPSVYIAKENEKFSEKMIYCIGSKIDISVKKLLAVFVISLLFDFLNIEFSPLFVPNPHYFSDFNYIPDMHMLSVIIFIGFIGLVLKAMGILIYSKLLPVFLLIVYPIVYGYLIDLFGAVTGGVFSLSLSVIFMVVYGFLSFLLNHLMGDINVEGS